VPILGAPVVAQLDPNLPSPTALQRQAAPSSGSVDWSGTYTGFALNTAKPAEPAKNPSWLDEPWAQDLAARLAVPTADGEPVVRTTFSSVVRSLARGVLRIGR